MISRIFFLPKHPGANADIVMYMDACTPLQTHAQNTYILYISLYIYGHLLEDFRSVCIDLFVYQGNYPVHSSVDYHM